MTLAIEPGERLLLVGPSGAGKSTLLRALAGLLETADAGELEGSVTVDGAAPGDRPGTVGLVLQEPGAGVVAATVARDVAFGPENIGMPRAAMAPVVTSALASVGLADLPLDTPTSALSGGQTQRLALAGTLALDPAVVLLDEPTAMLDPTSAREVRDAVSALSRGGGSPGRRSGSVGGSPGGRSPTLVVVEHDLAPWVDLVDRLVVLSADGQVVADGPVRETLREHRSLLLEMGVWVPGEPPPQPVPVDPALVGCGSAARRRHPVVSAGSAEESHSAASALLAGPFTVERTTGLLDGTRRMVRAAETSDAIVAAPGGLTVLVGPSGSGKSTVLHALAGFLAPLPEDAVTVPAPAARPGGNASRELTAPELASVLAWVPQWPSSTIVAGTVLDEVLVTTRSLTGDDAATTTRARDLLAAVGLAHLQDADPRHLSGGEQRRLALTAALLHGPSVLLADEPTVGQDRHTWAALVGLVTAYRDGGGAVVAATHDRHLVDRASDVQRLLPPAQPPSPTPTRTPLLARCGPLSLLVAALLAVPAGVLSPHWSTSLAVLATQVVLAVVGLSAPGRGARPTGRARRVALRMLPGLLAAASVGWSTWFLAGRDLDPAMTVALRVLVIVLPSAVLIPLIDPDELGDHLAQRLRMPDRPVVATAAALQRVQSFGAVWSEISRARRVRGIEVSWRRPRTLAAHVAALTMGLLVRTLRAAAELAVAMDARGFATATSRSWMAPAPWLARDSLVVALGTLPLAVAVLAR